jgi:hypothetical protein
MWVHRERRSKIDIEETYAPMSRVVCCNLFHHNGKTYYKAVEFGSVSLAVPVDRKGEPVFGKSPIIFPHDQQVRKAFKSRRD